MVELGFAHKPAVPSQSAREVQHFDPIRPTVFHQPWWLNAATCGDYHEAVVVQSGRMVGSFPYVRERVFGGQYLCGMPQLTHFLGPALDDGRGATCNRVLRRAQITRELLRQVPGCSGFWQKLHRGTRDTLAYQEQGYETAVQFTFEVAPKPPEIMWREMRDKTRNVIRRAGEQYTRCELADVEAFAEFYVGNVAASGRQSHYDRALIARVCDAAIQHGQGRILAAESASGELAAAIFYVWDTQAAYYLLTTRRRDSGNGAVSLLLWDAMRDVAARGLIFDFEGVVNSGGALFFTGFGGEVTPRYVVSKFTLGHKVAGRLSNPFRSRSQATYL